jgi:hypothetical protein
MTFTRYLLLLAITASLTQAAPIRHTIQFTGLTGPIPTAGSFFYDPVMPLFTGFFVEWNGRTFDLTASANAGGDIGANGVCGGGLSGAAYAYRNLTDSSGPCDPPFWTVFVFLTTPEFVFRRDTQTQTASSMIAWSIQAKSNVQIGGSPRPIRGEFTITRQDAVPEPSTVALTLLGGGALAAWRRRTRPSQ